MAWERRIQLRYRDLDYLGHLTAAAYLTLFEEARVAWMAESFGVELPIYVVARQEIDYLREVRLGDGPLTFSVAPVRLGRSSIAIEETLVTAGGDLRTRSRASLVMWRLEERAPRPLSAHERSALERQLTTRSESSPD
jgi:acyl-CoA thioester hydrolase